MDKNHHLCTYYGSAHARWPACFNRQSDGSPYRGPRWILSYIVIIINVLLSNFGLNIFRKSKRTSVVIKKMSKLLKKSWIYIFVKVNLK